jgi:hypothetical protein
MHANSSADRAGPRDPDEGNTGFRDTLDVAMVRSTTAAHHVQLRQPFLVKLRVERPQLGRIADIEVRGLVELRMALPRCVRAARVSLTPLLASSVQRSV